MENFKAFRFPFRMLWLALDTKIHQKQRMTNEEWSFMWRMDYILRLCVLVNARKNLVWG